MSYVIHNPLHCLIVRFCHAISIERFAVTTGPLRGVGPFNSRNISRTIYYPRRGGAKRPRPKLEFPAAACGNARAPDVQIASFIVHLSRLDACGEWYALENPVRRSALHRGASRCVSANLCFFCTRTSFMRFRLLDPLPASVLDTDVTHLRLWHECIRDGMRRVNYATSPKHEMMMFLV